MTSRTLKASQFALAAAAGTACLFVADNASSIKQSGLITQAEARIGRPATATSVAGVARRQTRRTVRRGAAIGAAAVGAAVGAGAYYGGGGAADYGTDPGANYGPYGVGGYPMVYFSGPGPVYLTPAPTEDGAPPEAYAAEPALPAAALPAAAPNVPAPDGTPYQANAFVPNATSATVVDPETGRRCTIQARGGWQWCWTP